MDTIMKSYMRDVQRNTPSDLTLGDIEELAQCQCRTSLKPPISQRSRLKAYYYIYILLLDPVIHEECSRTIKL